MNELRAARRLLEKCGWAGPRLEPFCAARGPGVRMNAVRQNPMEPLWLDTGWFQTLNPHVEGLERLSVEGALELAGAGPEAFEALERVVGEDLRLWLKQPSRTAEDVLRVFTTALFRSREKRT